MWLAAAPARTMFSASSGGAPNFVASPAKSTCTRTSSGSLPAGRLPAASSRRCSRSTESTDWMQAKASAAFLALLDCRWPMRCHLAGISAVSAIFCSPSWTLFSPKLRSPAAHASRTRSAPNVFETAMRVMSARLTSGALRRRGNAGVDIREGGGKGHSECSGSGFRFRVPGSGFSVPNLNPEPGTRNPER